MKAISGFGRLRWPRRMLGVLLATCLVPVLLMAEDAKSPHEEAVKQLSAAYAKLDGFIATYHSEGKNKMLDVTMGMDENSGLAAVQTIGVKDGKRHEFRQWSVLDGRVFMSSGGDLYYLDTYAVILKFLREVQDMVKVDDEQVNFLLTNIPYVVLEKTEVRMGLGPGQKDKPTWRGAVEGAQLKDSNDESVTFATDDHGDLTISRKTGLLVKQAMTGEHGEARVLELKDLRLNPGQGEVAKISAGWKTEGAKPTEDEMANLFRQKFVAALVAAVDEGECKLTDMTEFLKEKRVAVEDFVDGCVVETEGSLAAHPIWAKMVNEENFKKLVKAAQEKGIKIQGVENDADLEALLADKYMREELRDSFVRGCLETDGLAHKALGEILGVEKGVRLPAETPDGKAAAELLEMELARAYFTIVIDRKMRKFWSPPKDG